MRRLPRRPGRDRRQPRYLSGHHPRRRRGPSPGRASSPPEPNDVSAETPARGDYGRTYPASAAVSHPAHPMRCHIQDGPAINPATLALISCNATISTMIHDTAGAILDVGRRTRKPPPALRRAVRERDGYRCQFPGCRSRRTDAHHIVPLGQRRRNQAGQPHQPVQEHTTPSSTTRATSSPARQAASPSTAPGAPPSPALPEAPRRPRRHHHHPPTLSSPPPPSPLPTPAAPRPQPRHLDRLRQRPGQSRTPGTRTGQRGGLIVSVRRFAGRLPGPGIRARAARSLLPG